MWPEKCLLLKLAVGDLILALLSFWALAVSIREFGSAVNSSLLRVTAEACAGFILSLLAAVVGDAPKVLI